LDDRLWWLVVVEFQPSDWARGTYLNVGACWLWNVKDYLSFDVGFRLEGFIKFDSASGFEAGAQQCAARAVAEVLSLRARFATVSAVASHYIKECEQIEPNRSVWPWFHRGISCALSGQVGEAERSWEAIATPQANDYDWMTQARRDVATLALATQNGLQAFKGEVASRIAQARGLLKLSHLDASVIAAELDKRP